MLIWSIAEGPEPRGALLTHPVVSGPGQIPKDGAALVRRGACGPCCPAPALRNVGRSLGAFLLPPQLAFAVVPGPQGSGVLVERTGRVVIVGRSREHAI
jgi:hypothetical protein